MERETGIEPATNSLEGCDSTTELLPPTRLDLFADSPLRRGKPAVSLLPLATSNHRQQPDRCVASCLSPERREAPLAAKQIEEGPPPIFIPRLPRPTLSRARTARGKGWWGGEGSNLRSPKAADLQSAAIDHSATSPKYISCCSSGHDHSVSQCLYPLRLWAAALKPAHVIGVRVSDVSLKGGVTVRGAGGGI
jgi:hypothetical protein